MTPSGQLPERVQVTRLDVREQEAGRRWIRLHAWLQFRLFRVPSGQVAITARPWPRTWPPAETTIRAGTRRGDFHGKRAIWVYLSEPGWVQAFVQDKTGQPVIGARVVASNAKGHEVAAQETDYRGSASLQVGVGKKVRLAALPPGGGSPGVQGPEVPAGTSNVVIELVR